MVSIFENEFGDLVAWRVATLAVAATTIPAALAWSLLAHPAEVPAATSYVPVYATTDTAAATTPVDATEQDSEYPFPAPATETAADSVGNGSDDAAAPYAPGALQGTEQLLCLTDASREALRLSCDAWQLATFGDTSSTITVLEAPEVTPEATVVRLRVDRGGLRTWAEATIAPGGTWQVASRPEGLAADPSSPIPLADAARLATATGEPVASAVSAQLAASGLEGAEAAWTCAEAVAKDGQVTRLTIWLPREGADAVAYEAAYDTSVGVLALAPKDEGGI